MSTSDETYEFNVVRIDESDKAWLLVFDPLSSVEQELWVPKSVIVSMEKAIHNDPDDDSYDVEIKAWWCEKEGLEP